MFLSLKDALSRLWRCFESKAGISIVVVVVVSVVVVVVVVGIVVVGGISVAIDINNVDDFQERFSVPIELRRGKLRIENETSFFTG